MRRSRSDRSAPRSVSRRRHPVRRLCESAARRLAEREERGSRHALVDQSADGSGPRGRNEHASHHGHAAACTRTVRQLVSRADARRLHRLDQRGLDRTEDSRGNETLALGRPLRLHGLHGIRLRRAGPPLGHGVRSGARLGSRSRYRSQKRPEVRFRPAARRKVGLCSSPRDRRLRNVGLSSARSGRAGTDGAADARRSKESTARAW